MTSPSDEARELVRTGFVELGRAMAGIGGVHLAIADRVFKAVGPGGLPARVAHDAISKSVYATLRGGAGLAGAGAGAAVALRRGAEAHPLSTTRGGSLVIGALNGLYGDTLEREGSALAQPMSVRVGGHPVAAERDALAAAFPGARGRLVVFVHGLMETEHGWELYTERTGGSYGERLAEDLAITPVHIRYNTGRHISENGLSLHELLDELAAAWPAPLHEIALVGHSMGGLVARSACHQADAAGASWVRRVRHVVSLGTPHMGAPMAQAVHYLAHGLSALPETRPFGDFFKRRSAGIRDLRHGSLVDADWHDKDPDALRAAALQEVPLLQGATHHFVAATITHDPQHPLGRLIGDWLVLQPSASGVGRTRRIGFRDEDGRHLGGTNHIALLNHPAIYEQLRQWLSVSPEPEVPALPAPAPV
ncbi:MAG: esterase/lipase family protein [Solirubrobacteraceae bacterium]